MLSIGILGGTGPQGRGLARRLALAGHPVVLGSRSAERAIDTAAGLHTPGNAGRITGGGNDDAASADLVIVTVPYQGHADLLASLTACGKDEIVLPDGATVVREAATAMAGIETVHLQVNLEPPIGGIPLGPVLIDLAQAELDLTAAGESAGELQVEISGQLPFDTRQCHRFWAVRNFGPEVNLGGGGSIEEVRHIESIRRGFAYVNGPGKSTTKLWVKSLAKNNGQAAPEWWKEEYPIA